MIRLAKIFRDSMVLQREKPLRIWGECDRKQRITIALNHAIVSDTVCDVGPFMLILQPQQTRQDITMIVSGEECELTFHNVDVGEVFVAGGQSNMEFPLRCDDEADLVISQANDSHLRFYDVGKYSFEGEEAEGFKNSSCSDEWMSFSPENAGCFSAVGTYFAMALRENLHVPIGIIGCNWGGTTALTWLEESYLINNPKLGMYWQAYQTATEKLDLKKYEKRGKSARRLLASEPMQRMTENMLRGTPSFPDTIRALPAALKVISYTMTKGPADPNRPSGLYHTMVDKIAGYTCKAILWYHGESDQDRADVYDELFSALIACWRDSWKDELPFLFVQLAPYEKSQMGSGSHFPLIREKQDWVSRHVENAYMVSIMDWGMKNDIHPKHKRPVGERLALMACGKLFGQNKVCDSPALTDAQFESGHITLYFSHAGEGLYLLGNQLHDLQTIVNGRATYDFDIELENDVVVIKSGLFREYAAVDLLFARKSYCEVNLYNSAGLAAKPFQVSGTIIPDGN